MALGEAKTNQLLDLTIMPFAVSCPECDYQFRVPDHVEGQRGKCPKCKAMFLAARTAESPSVNATAAATATASVAATPNGQPAAGAAETTTSKPRTLTIPKPRLLETLAPPPAPEEFVAEEIDPLPLAPSERVQPWGVSSVEPPPPPAMAPARSAPPKAAPPKTVATAALPAIQLTTELSSLGETGAAMPYTQRRAKKSKRPLLLGIVALAFMGLVAVGLIGWRMGLGGMTVADRDAAGEDATAEHDQADSADEHPATTSSSDDEDPFKVVQAELKNWETLRQGIVTITAGSEEGTREGTGILLGGGIVATDFTLLHEADVAIVALADERKFEVAGVIKRPQQSLALLKLDGAAEGLSELHLAEKSPKLGDVVFVGEVQAAAATHVLGRVNVGALPALVRSRLPLLMRENGDVQLIQHDGRTSKLLDGRMYETPGGAPLLDAEGRVVGMNLALGDDAGYAIGVEQLAELIAASTAETFRPLRIGDVAGNDFPVREPQPPIDGPLPEGNRLGAALEKLTELSGMLAEKNWRPATADDYLGFAEFADGATSLTEMIDKLGPADQEESRPTIMAAIESLADAPWPSEDEIAKINELAGAASLNGDSLGVFAYAQCTLRPENITNGESGGVPLFGFQLIRSDEIILVPIAEYGDEVKVGSEWIILGRKDPMQFAELGSGDQKRKAAVVRVKYILQRP